MNLGKLEVFPYDGLSLAVDYVETVTVVNGVSCDVYSFRDDASKDLGVVTVKANFRTPRQRVLLGDETVEGFVSGKGSLIVESLDGRERYYRFGEDDNVVLSVEVAVGEVMQWVASVDTDLVFYEVCYPPYFDGRFETVL